MMEIPALLSTLRARDVKVWVEQDRLKFSAPAGAIDADMRATLASRKDEMLAYLMRVEALRRAPVSIVPLKPEGRRPPLFVLSGHGGDVYKMLALARNLDTDQPVLGVQPPGLDGSAPLETIEELAAYEIEQIRSIQPKGPYHLCGHCAGGTLAFEAAQQLMAAGQPVAFLGLIGSPYPTMFRKMPQRWVFVMRHVRDFSAERTFAGRLHYVRTRLGKREQQKEAPPEGSATALLHRERVERATVAAACRYQPRRYPGELHLFITSEHWHRSDNWRQKGLAVREHIIPGMDVDERLLAPNVAALASELQRVLADDADGASPVSATSG